MSGQIIDPIPVFEFSLVPGVQRFPKKRRTFVKVLFFAEPEPLLEHLLGRGAHPDKLVGKPAIKRLVLLKASEIGPLNF
jgi:hypothetical protein